MENRNTTNQTPVSPQGSAQRGQDNRQDAGSTERPLEALPEEKQIGYLRVRVTTAGGVIPLMDARVTITGNTKETSGVIHTTLSDRDGLTELYPLPTEPLSDSLTPGAAQPYTTYNLDVKKAGYFSQINIGIPIFSGVTSVQTVDLIPMSEEGNLYPKGDTRFFEGEHYFQPEEQS